MALAVILLLSRLILKPRTRKPSRAGTLVAGRTRCESNKTDSAFGFLCHWSRADVGQSFRDSVLSAAPPPSRWPNHRRAAMVFAALLEGAASAGLLAMAGCRARRSDALPDRSGGGRRLL